MNKGKHNKQTNGTAKKLSVLLISFLLIVGVTAGGTLAYLIAEADSITNIFTPSKVTTQVTETFQNDEKSDVKIKNTGDTEAYIRAAIVVTWKDENGNVYGQKPEAGTGKDYTISLNTTDWIEGKDGFYYYKYPVAPKDQNGSVTKALIVSCTVNQENTPAGYGLNVEILGSGIQSVPVSVVNTNWPAVSVRTAHGELTKVN